MNALFVLFLFVIDGVSHYNTSASHLGPLAWARTRSATMSTSLFRIVDSDAVIDVLTTPPSDQRTQTMDLFLFALHPAHRFVYPCESQYLEFVTNSLPVHWHVRVAVLYITRLPGPLAVPVLTLPVARATQVPLAVG